MEADLAKDADRTTLDIDASAGDVNARANATASGDSVKFDASVATLEKVGILLEIGDLPRKNSSSADRWQWRPTRFN